MADLDTLLAIHAIHGLKARYFRFVDTKRWDDLRSLFTPDALIYFPELQLHHPGMAIVPSPLDEAMASIITSLTGVLSVHQGFMPEIEILSDTEARGIWAMEDWLSWPSQDGGLPGMQVRGHGHYHEDYRRVAGQWRIHRLTLTRLSLASHSTTLVIAEQPNPA